MFGSGVALDVTSFISAQEFIVAQNRREEPADPFARDCYVEVVQSLIFQPRVWVLHPTLPAPAVDEFGPEPQLLQHLLQAGVVRPLRLSDAELGRHRLAEEEILYQLRRRGPRVLTDFVDQTLLVDSQQEGAGTGRVPLAVKLSTWSAFQRRHVRGVPEHHFARIRTSDGIEDDSLGDWSRRFADVAQGHLEPIAGGAEPKYIVAQLVRGLRYEARANAGSVHYQAHPMRRDFTLSHDLVSEGFSADKTVDLIRGVRGIYEDLARAIPDAKGVDLRLMELELPLLGGRVWESAERGQRSDREWVSLVARRIADYRTRTAELRRTIANCRSEEDHLRMQRHFKAVAGQLANRLGLAEVGLPALERDLLGAVDSVVAAVPGGVLPKVGGVWLSLRAIGKRTTWPREPIQRFLYREFSAAYRRAGR